jgi:O-antigen ligase
MSSSAISRVVVLADPVSIGVLLAVFAFLIWSGRIGFALGGFIAVWSWAFNIEVGSIVLVRLVSGVVILTAIARCVKQPRRVGWTTKTPVIRRFLVLVGAWTAWVVVNYVSVSARTEVDAQLLKNFLWFAIAPTILIIVFITGLSELREMAWGLIATSVVTSILYVLRGGGGASTGPGLWLGFSGINYLSYSFAYAISGLCCIGLLLSTKRRTTNTILLSSLGVCVITLLRTGARQSAIGFAVAAAYACWSAIRKRKTALRMFVAVTAVCSMYVLVYASRVLGSAVVADRWEESLVGSDIGVRQELWLAAWRAFSSSPVVGAGTTYAGDGLGAHNLILDLLASQGLIGLMFFVIYAAVILSAIRRTCFQTRLHEYDEWRVILVAILIYTAVHSFASGSVLSIPHFFWAPSMLVQLGVIAEWQRRAESVGSRVRGLYPGYPGIVAPMSRPRSLDPSGGVSHRTPVYPRRPGYRWAPVLGSGGSGERDSHL